MKQGGRCVRKRAPAAVHGRASQPPLTSCSADTPASMMTQPHAASSQNSQAHAADGARTAMALRRGRSQAVSGGVSGGWRRRHDGLGTGASRPTPPCQAGWRDRTSELASLPPPRRSHTDTPICKPWTLALLVKPSVAASAAKLSCRTEQGGRRVLSDRPAALRRRRSATCPVEARLVARVLTWAAWLPVTWACRRHAGSQPALKGARAPLQAHVAAGRACIHAGNPTAAAAAGKKGVDQIMQNKRGPKAGLLLLRAAEADGSPSGVGMGGESCVGYQ